MKSQNLVRNWDTLFQQIANPPFFRPRNRRLKFKVRNNKQVELAEQNDEYLVLVMHDATHHFMYDATWMQLVLVYHGHTSRGVGHWVPHSPPWLRSRELAKESRHDYYSEVLTGSRTIAVFAGHLHPQGGFKGNLA